ncbi:unnamed protein product [Prunus armeniaca]
MVVSDSVKERRVDLGSGEAGQCRWRTWAWWRSWAVGLEREREREREYVVDLGVGRSWAVAMEFEHTIGLI